MMKKLFIILLLPCAFLSMAQVTPLCNVSYAISGSSVFLVSNGAPATTTLMPFAMPTGCNGLAIGPSFGFSMVPNPTFWTIRNNMFWYFNGTTFVNTGHSAGANAQNLGGSLNFIYSTSGTRVYKYKGTSNAASVATISLGHVADIAGDDLDNFYLFELIGSPQLKVYDSLGTQTCTYSATGLTNFTFGGDALAINGNTVAMRCNSGYYKGVLSGATLSFTNTVYGNTATPGDFASCVRTVSFTPSITASPSSTISCANGTITLTATNNINATIDAYNWAGPGITGASSLQSVQVFMPGVYTCTLTNCEMGDVVTNITVTGNVSTPTLTTFASDGTICSGQTLTLSASGATSYTWASLGSTVSTIAVSPTITTTYTIIGETMGCQAVDSIIIIVNVTPTLSAAANPATVCSGGSSTLTCTSNGVGFIWMPGSLQGQTVTTSPGSTTVYTVVTSIGSCSAEATTTVFNPVSPTVVVSGNTLTCTSPTIQAQVITTSSNDAISWNGPGISSPNNSSTLSISLQGTYSLIVTNTVINCSSLDLIEIYDQIAPLILNIVPSTTQICIPARPSTNMQINTPAFCSWSPTTNINPTTGPLVTASPTVTTTYTVSGVLGVCSGTAAITLSVSTTPTIQASLVSPMVCSGAANTLVATGAISYSWQPGGLVGDSVIISPRSTGVYTVYGMESGCFSPKELTVTVIPKPQLSPTAWPVVICEGNTTTLTATNASTYNWLPGGSSAPSLAVSPTVTTTYTVSGTNSLGCTANAVMTVYVNHGPPISASSTASSICKGDSVMLNASGAPSFTWMPGNFTGSLVIVKPFVTTQYTVVASNTACTSMAKLNIDVGQCALPIFGITNAASKPFEESGDSYRINFTITTFNAGQNTLNNVILNNDLKSTFPSPGTYSVISPPVVVSSNSGLKANPFYDGTTDISLLSNGSSIVSDKKDTLEFSVIFQPKGFYGTVKNSVIGLAEFFAGATISDTSNNGFSWDPDHDGNPGNNNTPTPIEIGFIDLFIPQGFSPNNDNYNETFVIKGLYDRQVKFTVFNRWGNKVYEKDHYDNTWDGSANVGGMTTRDNKLPPSTYYYILQFRDGGKEVKTGFVVLSY